MTCMSRADFDDVVAGPRPVAESTASHRATTPLESTGPLWPAVAGPLAVTALAAILRLTNLGTPRTLVFDETYYVKDSWTLLHLGYEGQWPENADADFNAGIVDGYSAEGSYIAHPPLGKWIIALGLRVFGADDPVGWRITTALVGILAVALVCLVAYLLFRSSTLATVAGGLMAVDGLAIVMSRTALLDNSLMLFCLLGVTAVLLDRAQSAGRLAAWVSRRADAGRSTDWGPALWARPWLITAGLMFGLATAVKWSGLYFLAGFAIYTLLVDAVARRRAGVRFWATSAVLRQAPASFLLTVPVAALAYVASWSGWFATSGGYDRDWAASRLALGDAAGGSVVTWIPAALQSFWHYQVSIYSTNVTLSTPHGYEASPLGWLALIRPTAFFYESVESGQDGCAAETCVTAVSSIANPVLWWLSVAAAIYLVYRLIRHREWQVGLVLTGIAVGYLPWLLYLERTVFQFYTIVFLPYLVLGLTFALSLVAGSRADSPDRRRLGVGVVVTILAFVVLVSAFFYPEWAGLRVPGLFHRLHYWFPGWI